ncbi:MAG: phosphatase [Richelia sp. RM2_1_2]|nr:phosphatase [Richelia sp. RM2_1_2]
MREINGDLIKLAKEKQFDLIAHSCNCQHNFGAGIVKSIATNFPIAEQVDKETFQPKLGDISITYIPEFHLNIVNCYTQIWFGKAFGVNTKNWNKDDTAKNRYAAIKECFKKINEQFTGLHIGLHMIELD